MVYIPDRLTRRQLLRTHSDYEKVVLDCQLFTDAAEGTGGFHPFNEVLYSDTSRSHYTDIAKETYLTSFEWETDAQFKRRITASPYKNIVKPRVLEPIKGYLSAPPERLNYTPAFINWLDDATKEGLSYDNWLQTDGLHKTLVCGFYPTLIVSDPWVGETELERQQQGAKLARLVPIAPENLLDWAYNSDGDYEYIKYITSFVVSDALSEPKYFNRVWYITSSEWYYVDFEVTSSGNPRQNNTYDVVAGGEWDIPLDAAPVIRRTLGGGNGIIKDLFEIIRDSFNSYSEYRHLQRAQNFSLLTIQISKNDDEKKATAIATGAKKALTYSDEVQNRPEYITPGKVPPEDYRNNLANITQEILEIGGTSSFFGQPPATATEAQYRFSNFNNKIVSLTKELARDEVKTLELVGKWINKEFDLELTPIYKSEFYLKDLDREINNSKTLLELGYPEQVANYIRSRLLNFIYKDTYTDELKKLVDETKNYKAVEPKIPQE